MGKRDVSWHCSGGCVSSGYSAPPGGYSLCDNCACPMTYFGDPNGDEKTKTASEMKARVEKHLAEKAAAEAAAKKKPGA